MSTAIPERRGDYDTGRKKDSLVYTCNGVRAAMFVNEVGDIGCAVDVPSGGAVAFSMSPVELIEWLRVRGGVDAPDATEVLRRILRCRYPVCTSINPSGYGWDTPRLNEVIADLAADGVALPDLRQSFETWTKRQHGDEMPLEGAQWGINWMYSHPMTQAAWVGYQAHARGVSLVDGQTKPLSDADGLLDLLEQAIDADPGCYTLGAQFHARVQELLRNRND